ncbi:zinc-finger-containing protein [Latilactobacillus sakei]|uniref:zinc-finger-containing protein n=1 Tax=Latilactobacillus sakei TaxID=1599 RepID=UPI0009759B56|nr:zinc-finger-containing protein [Latilactobacillus sakei]
MNSLTSNPPEWDKQPCPYCGGTVIYVSNAMIYHGRQFGNGMCYVCAKCKASVGVHGRSATRQPLGILATEDMKNLKVGCHTMFDLAWKSGAIKRGDAYKIFAKKMNIPARQCHFGWFVKSDLERALKLLQEGKWWEQ